MNGKSEHQWSLKPFSWTCIGLVLFMSGLLGVIFAPELSTDELRSVLPWVASGPLLVGFVSLLIKFPRLASAIQTVLLMFMAVEMVAGLLTRSRDK